MKTLTVNKISLFLFFVQGEGCFTGIEKTFLLSPFLFGACLLFRLTSKRVSGFASVGAGSRKMPTHTPTASPLIYRHDREVVHPEHSFLAAWAPCSLSHHHLWAVLFPTSFPASTLTPDLFLTSHCFSLCFVPHIPHYRCFLFHIIPGWCCAEPSISWPTVSHVSFHRGFQLSVGVFATGPAPSWEGTNLQLWNLQEPLKLIRLHILLNILL